MAARRLGYQKETCGKCGLFSWNLIDLIGFIIKLYSYNCNCFETVLNVLSI